MMAVMTAPATHADLLAALRDLHGIVEKGRTPAHFYHRSRAFLHFHGTGDHLVADVRRADHWERWPVGTPEGRAALLCAVREHLTGAAQPS
jgi:hypothetical protein